MAPVSNHLGNLAILSPYEHLKVCQVAYVRHNLPEHIAQHLPNLEYVTHFERHHKQVVFLRDRTTGLYIMTIEGSVPPTPLDIICHPRRFAAHWFRNLEDGIGTSTATSFGKEIAQVQEAVGNVGLTSNHSGGAFVANHADVRDQLDEAAKLAVAPHIKRPDENTLIIRPEHCPLGAPIINRHDHKEYIVPGEHDLKSIKEKSISPYDVDDEDFDVSKYGVISPKTRWADIHPELADLDTLDGIDQGPKRDANEIQVRKNRYEALEQRSKWNPSRLKKKRVAEDVERLEANFLSTYGMTVEEFQQKERDQLPVKQIPADAYPQTSFKTVKEAQEHFEGVIKKEIYAEEAKKGKCDENGKPKSRKDRTKAKKKAEEQVMTDPRFLREAEAIRARDRIDQEVALGRSVVVPNEEVSHAAKSNEVSHSREKKEKPVEIQTSGPDNNSQILENLSSTEETEIDSNQTNNDVVQSGALLGVVDAATNAFFSTLAHSAFFTSVTNYLSAPEDRHSTSEMTQEVLTESTSSAVTSGALHLAGNMIGHSVVGFLSATVSLGTQLVTVGRVVYQLYSQTEVEGETLTTIPLDKRMCRALTPLEPPTLSEMPGVTGSVLRHRRNETSSHEEQGDLDDLILEHFKRG